MEDQEENQINQDCDKQDQVNSIGSPQVGSSNFNLFKSLWFIATVISVLFIFLIGTIFSSDAPDVMALIFILPYLTIIIFIIIGVSKIIKHYRMKVVAFLVFIIINFILWGASAHLGSLLHEHLRPLL